MINTYFNLPYSNGYTQVVYFADEIFRDYPYDISYKISNYGRVYDKLNNVILYPSVTNYGYIRYNLRGGKSESGHRLVIETFMPEWSSSQTINHINENKTDNRLSNLEPMTNAENVFYSINRKRSKDCIENDVVYDFSPEIKDKICQLIDQGYGSIEIANILGLNIYTGKNSYKNFIKLISKVKQGYRWQSISYKYSFGRNNPKISRINVICQYLQQGKSSRQIAELLGEEYNDNFSKYISSIRSNRRWKTISQKYNFESYHRRSTKEIETFCQLLAKGLPYSKIAELTGNEDTSAFSSMLSSIKHGNTWKEYGRKYDFVK